MDYRDTFFKEAAMRGFFLFRHLGLTLLLCGISGADCAYAQATTAAGGESRPATIDKRDDAAAKNGAGTPTSAADRAIIKEARAAYYNPKSLGLREFQASLEPDWQRLLKFFNVQNADQVLAILKEVKFRVVVDSTGCCKATHQLGVASPNRTIQDGIETRIRGVEMAIEGLFKTWSPFMLDVPLPDPSGEFELQDSGGQYRVSCRGRIGETRVVIFMSKSLLIQEAKVSTPEFITELRPQFKKVAGGFLLVGYDITNSRPDGKDVTQLHAQMDYRDIDGLQLLNKLDLSGFRQANSKSPRKNFETGFGFGKYTVKREER